MTVGDFLSLLERPNAATSEELYLAQSPFLAPGAALAPLAQMLWPPLCITNAPNPHATPAPAPGFAPGPAPAPDPGLSPGTSPGPCPGNPSMADAQAHALPMTDAPDDPPDATAATPMAPPSPSPLAPPLAEADSAMVDGPDLPSTPPVSEGCGEEASGVPAPTAEARARGDPRGPWEGHRGEPLGLPRRRQHGHPLRLPP